MPRHTRPMGVTCILRDVLTGDFVVEFVLFSSDMRATVPEALGLPIHLRCHDPHLLGVKGLDALPGTLRGWIADAMQRVAPAA